MSWQEKINAARARQKDDPDTVFTPEDRRLAQWWVSSPSSQLKVELDDRCAPVDPALYHLEKDFMSTVERYDVDRAQDLLEAIEARAEELKAGESE